MDLRDRIGIVVEGITFKAVSIRIDDAINCEIRKCEVLYPLLWFTYKTSDYGGRDDGTCGEYVSGKSNYLWRNRIARSWGIGIRIEGSDNILEQCLIEDIVWLVRRMAAVHIWGLGNHLLRNVIRKYGNTGIDRGYQGLLDVINDKGETKNLSSNHQEIATPLLKELKAWTLNVNAPVLNRFNPLFNPDK